MRGSAAVRDREYDQYTQKQLGYSRNWPSARAAELPSQTCNHCNGEECKTIRQRKKALADALKQKWSESTTGPPEVLREALEGGDEEFRTRLLGAQGMCPELKPLIEAARKLLGATLAESTKGR